MLEKGAVPLQIILTSKLSTPEFYAFNAFFKSLCREFGFFFKSIKHDFSKNQENEYWGMINHETEDIFGIETQYDKGKRLAKQWKPLEINPSYDEKIRTKIVIIGGAKGLAFELFSRIDKSHDIELVVWGRSSLLDTKVQKNIKSLKKKLINIVFNI
mgnify:CR=1 FL=1